MALDKLMRNRAHAGVVPSGVNGVVNGTIAVAPGATRRKDSGYRGPDSPVKVPAAAVAADTDAAEWKPHPIMAMYRNHQIDVPLAILLLTFAGAYVAPTSVFGRLAYPSYRLQADAAAAPVYDKGWLDVLFVGYYFVFWTFARAFAIEYVIKPVGRRLGCRRAMEDRFGEQGWLVMYYTPSFLIGLGIMYQSAYWTDFAHFWIDYPHRYLTGPFKTYYLMQLAFWIQQLFVVHIEKPRRDYAQYVVHHLVTCALILSSYVANFTRVGNAVLVTMDVADIFLSSAKCLNYAKWQRVCDAMFGFFVLVWVYSRHYFYMRIVYSVWTDFLTRLPLRWDPPNGLYATHVSYWFFIALLGALQVLLLVWFYMILRIVVRVLSGKKPEDTRSDEEDEEDDGCEPESSGKLQKRKAT